MPKPTVALVTDFGIRDHYVASLKAAVLRVTPEATIVDVSHHLDAADMVAAAFFIDRYFEDFPPGTVHLVVVDPGVGGDRRALVVVLKSYFFVGPDNGIFSLIYRHPTYQRTVAISADQVWAPKKSPTFDGRDLFAPVAARLADGADPISFGKEIGRPVILGGLDPEFVPPGVFILTVVHCDRFGNLITNLKDERLKKMLGESSPDKLTVRIGPRIISGLSVTFSSVPPGGPLAYVGSSGYLEIGVNRGSAAEFFNLGPGETIMLEIPGFNPPIPSGD